MEISRNKIFSIAVIVLLLTMIFVRCFFGEENCTWITGINFFGIIVACLSFYFETYICCKKCNKIHLFSGMFACVLIILVILEVFIVFGLVKVSELANDIITLVTLLISLPTRFYIKLLSNILK